jgi:hypothetical protein
MKKVYWVVAYRSISDESFLNARRHDNHCHHDSRDSPYTRLTCPPHRRGWLGEAEACKGTLVHRSFFPR